MESKSLNNGTKWSKSVEHVIKLTYRSVIIYRACNLLLVFLHLPCTKDEHFVGTKSWKIISLAHPFPPLHFFSVFLHLNISPDNSITSCEQFWSTRLTGLNKHSHALSHSQSRQEDLGGMGCVQVSFTINKHIYKWVKWQYIFFTSQIDIKKCLLFCPIIEW